MSRKAIAAIAALVLMVGILPAAQAQGEAVSIDMPMPEEAWFLSGVMHQGQVLLFSARGIYAYKPGDAAPVLLMKTDEAWREKGLPNELILTTDEDGALYGVQVNPQRSALYPLTLEGDQLQPGEVVELEVQGNVAGVSEEEDNMELPRHVLLAGGRLYTLFKNWGPQGAQITLLSFDAKVGGRPQIHKAESVQQLARYKDGTLLTLLMDDENNFDPVTQRMKAATLATFDPSTDDIKEIGSTGFPYDEEASALLYETESDTAYLLGRGEIYRKTGQGEVQLSAYFNSGNYGAGGRIMLTAPGQVAVLTGDGLAIRSTDPAQLPATILRVYGDTMPDDAMLKAIAAMNNVTVTFFDDTYFYDEQQLGRALDSDTAGIDIFFLFSYGMDLESLMRNGYTLDLSENRVFAEFAASTYPVMREAGELDGRLHMLPVDVYGQFSMGYYPEVFKDIGLEPPKTFKALTEFMQKWNDSLAKEHPEVAPFARSYFDELLIEIALSLYADTAAGEGREFSFSDPLLRQMLEQASSLDLSNISTPRDRVSVEVSYGEDGKRYLFENGGFLELGSINRSMAAEGLNRLKEYSSDPQMPLPLAAGETGKPYAGLTLQTAAINPKSKNIDAAVKFLELYLQNLEPVRTARMNYLLNEEVPNPNYKFEAGYIDYELAASEKAVAAAQGEEKTELQQNHDLLVRDSQRRKEQLMNINLETIKLYSDLLANSYVQTNNGLGRVFENYNIVELFESFLQKQISLDQFLNEAQSLESLTQP